MSTTRTREYFINELSTTGTNKNDAKKIFNLFIDTVIEGIIEDKEVNLKNFGKFILTRKKKTEFVNPKTGKISKIKFPEKVKFTPSVNLIKYINSNG